MSEPFSANFMLQVNFFGKQSVYLVGCRVSFTRTIKESDGKELSPDQRLRTWFEELGLGIRPRTIQ